MEKDIMTFGGKMKKELVSVIIPVYNVETYLERCIESLLHQTYDMLEIIIVDDGSTDKCPDICDRYGKEYASVKVIHKKNGGLADARNTGLEHASGNFITFIDSDDFVSVYYIENLYKAMIWGNADLSVSMFENLPEGESLKSCTCSLQKDSIKICSDEECLRSLLYQKGIETSAPGKLYKRESIGKLRFPKGHLYEDIIFVTTMISRSKKIAVIQNVDYYYFQRKGSIQYQSFSLKKLDCVKFSRELNEFIKKNYPVLSNAADCRYFGAICNIIFQIPKDQYEKEKRALWNDIKTYRINVIKDRHVRKKTKYAAVLSYLGYETMLYIYRKTQIRGRYLKRI